MSPLIFAAVLFAALLHASWNALIKVSGDRLVVMAITTASASLIVSPLLFLLPLPAMASWPYLAMSCVVHTAYMLLLVRAYSFGDFAQVYPLARGSAPLLTALFGFLLLGEVMSSFEIIGMALIVGGIFMLAIERLSGIRQMSVPAVVYSLLTGLSIAAYSLIDGSGVRVADNTHSFTAWMFFLDGLFVPIIAFLRTPRILLLSTVNSVWKSGVLVALLSLAGYWLIVWAFSQERIAPVAVLRETSVLFALLISVFVIKEQFSRLRVVIVLLIVSGIVLLGFQ